MANDSSPDPYITMLYEATKGGYKAFKKEWVTSFDWPNEVYIAFDGDDAGAAGASEIQWMFVEAGLTPPKLLRLPEGHDVCSYFARKDQ